MTARIVRSFDFQAGVYFGDEFYMNTYELDMQFNVETDSIREQNVALERIKYFLDESLESAIMCSENDKVAIDKFVNADMKVCTLPEEPFDQIVGIMLMSKLNAIAEGRLVITDITIGSRMSDGVSCLHSIDENMGPFETKGWWKDNTSKINNYVPEKKNAKVVKLAKPVSDWDDLYLGWEEKDPFTKGAFGNEIVFASFDNKLDK
jgi:hypothetical protein